MAHLTGQERARYVTRMFARISKRYDLLNTVMTGGRHYAWRKRATRMAVEGLHGPALDIATGTGDFAFDLARRPEVTDVVGMDFTREMLTIANDKATRQKLSDQTTFATGDAHSLPFRDEQFICTTVGFGIRNFIDLPTALREMVRVVRPGGRVVSLEIVRMDGRGLLPRLLPLHFRYVTPWLGSLIAGDREAYTYLPKSVENFLSASELDQAMRDAGLKNVSHKKLGLGTVAIHIGEKPL
jgi:demethylmenaquinone methyltransferase/2-methoxy-6-polyprenyl-1,4-benzoquinol methylase